jgi:hypothetical protein
LAATIYGLKNATKERNEEKGKKKETEQAEKKRETGRKRKGRKEGRTKELVMLDIFSKSNGTVTGKNG